MSAGRSGIAVSLGSLQHLRKQPAAETRITATAEYPDTQVPAPRLVQRNLSKRSDPNNAQLKAYVPKRLKKDAMRKAEQLGYQDFSTLVQELLEEFLAR